MLLEEKYKFSKVSKFRFCPMLKVEISEISESVLSLGISTVVVI